jgi:PKD repeat protein
MWINNAELNGSAGVDDDGNGYTDDWIGWDFIQSTSSCWSGEDCNTQDNDPRDFNGHGTHTSGIFGMLTNNGYGMAGVAGGWGNGTQQVTGNGVKIMALRMGYSYNYLGQEYGVVLMDAAASAFYYAANKGVKIASCSWGSSNSGGIGAAVTNFINNGGLVFVAAGNAGNQTADYLNARGDCISVSATDENDNGASFTTYGTWVDICAPGNNIYSTYHDHTDPNTNYWASLSGTSMATPMTAGVAALIWSQNPGWSASQVSTQLYNTSDNIDAFLSSQYIGKMGAGRINAYNAVNTGPPPAPVANFSGSPTSGTVPLTVNFTDLSTGSITSWSWTFGDGGTSTAQNPSHQYTSTGTYTVSLTVTGPGGSDGEIKTNYITVNPCVAPVANFSGAPTSGTAPLLVDFTDLSTGSPTSWSWNFGDGGTSTSQNPSHTYTSAGSYTVSLTATNSCGSDGETKTAYITVSPGSAWTVIHYADFETGLNGYTDGGADCSRYTGGTHAHQGRAAMDIQDNSGTSSSFSHTATYNVSGYSQLEIEFWFKAVSYEVNEDFFVEYYNGSVWQIVADIDRGPDFVNNTFYNVVVTLDNGPFTFPTNARLRFRSDASDNNDDIYIDEIEWRGMSGGSSVAVGDLLELPAEYTLSQNYPNPFNPSTDIEFTLPVATDVRLDVYNVLGQRVAELADGPFNAGKHVITWNATQYASGVYFYRLQADEFVETKKMLLLK